MSQKDPDTLVPANDTDERGVMAPRRRRAADVAEGLRSGRRPDLATLLRRARGEDISDLAQEVTAARDAITSMLRDIADVEALGDPTLQDHGARAAAVRRLFVMFKGREPIEGEDVGVMMEEIHRMRAALVDKEAALIQQETGLVQTRRGAEVQQVRDLNGHIAILEQAEIEGAKAAADRVDELIAARTGLIARQNEGDVRVSRLRIEGDVAREAIALERARALRPIQEGLLVVGTEADHAKALLKKAADLRLRRAEMDIGSAVDREDDKKKMENIESNKAQERNKRLSLWAMTIAQLVSGYLAAKGVHGMSLHPDELSSWIFPIGSSVAANGTVLVCTSQYLYGNWEMEGNKGLTALFAFAVALTATAGYAGAAREMIPEVVLADAVKDRVTETTAFVEAARPVVADKFTNPANSLVLDMKQAGSALKDEATGRGPSHEYGFRSHSIDALARYRVTVDAAARGLASAGMCDDLRLMASDYQALMDGLQYEYEHPTQAGGFAASPFVTLDENGEKKYDVTFDSQITACDASYPLSPTELITSIDSNLTAIRDGLADGSIADTPQINEKIRVLNANIQKLATALKLDTTKLAALASGVTPTTTAGGAPAPDAPADPEADADAGAALEAPDLKELEPMTYESLALLVEHTVNLFVANWDELSIKYPGMGIVSLAIDQLGLILALVALATSKRVDAKNRAYTESLTRVESGEARAAQLYEGLKKRLAQVEKDEVR